MIIMIMKMIVREKEKQERTEMQNTIAHLLTNATPHLYTPISPLSG